MLHLHTLSEGNKLFKDVFEMIVEKSRRIFLIKGNQDIFFEYSQSPLVLKILFWSKGQTIFE